MNSSDCLFCKIIAGEIPATKVYESDEMCAFRDVNPQAPEHVLIVPKRHVGGVDKLNEEDARLAGRLLVTAKHIAEELKVQEGSYRLVINNGRLAGQTVFHLHVHLLAGRAMMWPPG